MKRCNNSVVQQGVPMHHLFRCDFCAWLSVNDLLRRGFNCGNGNLSGLRRALHVVVSRRECLTVLIEFYCWVSARQPNQRVNVWKKLCCRVSKHPVWIFKARVDWLSMWERQVVNIYQWRRGGGQARERRWTGLKEWLVWGHGLADIRQGGRLESSLFCYLHSEDKPFNEDWCEV